MEPLQILTAVAGDLDWLLATDPVAAGDERRSRFLRLGLADGRCEIACIGGQRAGFAVWHRQFFSRPFLALLVVDSAYRRRGIGTALVRHVMATIGQGDDFFTSTNASNHAAQRLFERLGFVRSGTIEHIDPGDPEWIYVLRRERG